MNKLCSTCKYLGCLVNQGIYWCTENCNMDLDTCIKYEALFESTTICSDTDQLTINLYWER